MTFSGIANLFNCFFEIILACLIIIHLTVLHINKYKKIEKDKEELEKETFINLDTNQLYNLARFVDKLDDLGTFLEYNEERKNKFIEKIINSIISVLEQHDIMKSIMLNKILVTFYNADLSKEAKNTLIKDIKTL